MDSLQRLSQSITQAISLVATLRREKDKLLAELQRQTREKDQAQFAQSIAPGPQEFEALRAQAVDLSDKLKHAEEHVTQYAQDLEHTREQAQKEREDLQEEIKRLKQAPVPTGENRDEAKQAKKLADQMKKERNYLKQKLEEIHGDLESLRLV